MSAAGRSRTRGTTRVVLIGLVIGVVLAFGLLAYRYLSTSTPEAPDFEGEGTGTVMLHVADGETLGVVGDRLVDLGVVKSTRAFTNTAFGTSVEGIQPGYYQVRREMSAKSAVDQLADPEARVGFVDVKPGDKLLDTHVVGGQTQKGVFTQISEASCLRDLDQPAAPPRCHSPQEVVDAAAQTDPAQLGVPQWALQAVSGAPDPVRRLEGLIAPGVHNVDPSSTPVEMLTQLVTGSARTYEQTGLGTAPSKNGLDAYQTLVAASLVEKEAHKQDMDKVARVILNRLAAPMQLQFDSTVNYALPDQEVATTDADRGARTPWNTYAMDGLPYGPIGAPGLDALTAMENPAEGPWKYFVTVDQQGTTKFAADYPEHERNQAEAIRNGVLASGR